MNELSRKTASDYFSVHVVMVLRHSTQMWQEYAMPSRWNAELFISLIPEQQRAGNHEFLDIERAIIRPAMYAGVN